MTFFSEDRKETAAELSLIGPEPLEKSFGVSEFRKRLLLRSKWKIKQVLMDQSVLAGIGNIYSDEILWKSCVHPLRAVESLSDKEMSSMYKAMRSILKESIRVGGDSASDFRNIDGNRGGFQHRHKAYRQTGKECTKGGCKGVIRRLKIGGRSAHFCTIHQKTPRN